MSEHAAFKKERLLEDALARLRSSIKLTVLEAPGFIVENAWCGAERALKALGPSGAEAVSLALPRYLLKRDAVEQAERAWERRCEGCRNWRGYPGMVELIDRADDDEVWCTRVAREDRSTPDPCPHYRQWNPM